MSANHDKLALRLGQLKENIDKILKITTDEIKVSEKAPKAGKNVSHVGKKGILKLIVPMKFGHVMSQCKMQKNVSRISMIFLYALWKY